MKLLIFGGTFDPPHIGHLSILENAIACVQPDKALVIPANDPPHKAASGTPAALRLGMCRCFLAVSPMVEISDIETSRGGTSYTYQTVGLLQEQCPDAAIYLCIGSDMLCTFTEWRNWRELLKAVTLVAQPRTLADETPAHEAAKALEAEGGRVVFTEGAVQPAASRDLREAIAAGLDVWGEIPPEAAEVIRANHLYQPATVAGRIRQAKNLAKEKLAPKRYIHVANVAAAARELANRFGGDEDRAELAAWLHDIVKEEDRDGLLRLLERDAIIHELTLARPYPVWHGPCAAIYARHTLGIEDEELLQALDCHTTGRPGMTKFEKILFLADKISAERDYEGLDKIRRLAETDLDAAVVATLQHSLAYTEARGKQIDEESLMTLRDLQGGC